MATDDGKERDIEIVMGFPQRLIKSTKNNFKPRKLVQRDQRQRMININNRAWNLKNIYGTI